MKRQNKNRKIIIKSISVILSFSFSACEFAQNPNVKHKLYVSLTNDFSNRASSQTILTIILDLIVEQNLSRTVFLLQKPKNHRNQTVVFDYQLKVFTSHLSILYLFVIKGQRTKSDEILLVFNNERRKKKHQINDD